jgi:hypothetical protein
MRCTRVCGQENSRSPYLRPRSCKAGAAQLPAQAWGAREQSRAADERYQQCTLRDVKCRADPDPLRRRARVNTVTACCHRQGEHPGLQSAEPGCRRYTGLQASASFAKMACAVNRNTV